MEGLTEGRVTHYVAYNDRHLAAMITGYNPDKDGHVDLVVFTNMPNFNGEKSGGVQFHFNVPYSETPKPGHWHWPEKA